MYKIPFRRLRGNGGRNRTHTRHTHRMSPELRCSVYAARKRAIRTRKRTRPGKNRNGVTAGRVRKFGIFRGGWVIRADRLRVRRYRRRKKLDRTRKRSLEWMEDHFIIILSLKATINYCVQKNVSEQSSIIIL